MSSDYPAPNLRPGGYNIYTVVILARNPGGRFGGYKADFFINPMEQQCAFCRQIPRDPYRVPCGHLFCQDCLFNYLINLRQPCNQCRAPINEDDCVSDPQLTKLISDSSISCPFSEKCQWVGPLSSLSLHFSECTRVNPMTRSWMQSIQLRLSSLAGESGRLERRVDRLSELVKKMDSSCEAATYEYEKRLGWIGNQMNGIQEVLRTSPGDDFIEPTPVPRFLQPTDLYGFASLDIDDENLTPSLRYDLGRCNYQIPPRQENPEPSPKRNFRFSVYEDHVRLDTGDLDFALDHPDDDNHDDDEIEVFVHDDTDFIPHFPSEPESVKCLNCFKMNPGTSKYCNACNRIL